MQNYSGRGAATRFMSVPLLGHALHVCATGVAASCAAGPACVGVGPNSIWPGSLGRQATWERRFESSRRSSIPAAAQRRRLGEGGAQEGPGTFNSCAYVRLRSELPNLLVNSEQDRRGALLRHHTHQGANDGRCVKLTAAAARHAPSTQEPSRTCSNRPTDAILLLVQPAEELDACSRLSTGFSIIFVPALHPKIDV